MGRVNRGALLSVTVVLLFCFTTSCCNENSDKIAVLITDWGAPEGFSDSYWRNMAERSRFISQSPATTSALPSLARGRY